MAPSHKITERLGEYWKPDLVREACQIAIQTPRDQMEIIMVQATEFMEQLPWKGEKTTAVSYTHLTLPTTPYV